jgi:hypothetical protein
MARLYLLQMSLRVIIVGLSVFSIGDPSCVNVPIWRFLVRPHMQIFSCGFNLRRRGPHSLESERFLLPHSKSLTRKWPPERLRARPGLRCQRRAFRMEPMSRRAAVQTLSCYFTIIGRHVYIEKLTEVQQTIGQLPYSQNPAKPISSAHLYQAQKQYTG